MDKAIKAAYIITCSKKIRPLKKLIARWKAHKYCEDLSYVKAILDGESRTFLRNGLVVSDAMNDLIVPYYTNEGK